MRSGIRFILLLAALVCGVFLLGFGLGSMQRRNNSMAGPESEVENAMAITISLMDSAIIGLGEENGPSYTSVAAVLRMYGNSVFVWNNHRIYINAPRDRQWRAPNSKSVNEPLVFVVKAEEPYTAVGAFYEADGIVYREIKDVSEVPERYLFVTCGRVEEASKAHE